MTLLIVITVLVNLVLIGAAWISSVLDLGLSSAWFIVPGILMILGCIAWYFYRRWTANRHTVALRKELEKQAQAQAASTRPDRQAEVIELQSKMAQAIETLKKTKLGKKHGAGVLYVLPWYAIIGPPGAGKTTALRHSGLNFPLASGSNDASLKGVGGTRNCDWWFTDEGILLDTAGRYAIQSDDTEEWFSFLDALGTHRRGKPLNGLIVAVSLAEIASQSEEQLLTLSNTLRERLDEIIGRLGITLPTYVVFTKSDLVHGFVDYWGDLKRSERDQVLGATIPLEDAHLEAGQLFEREFDVIIDELERRAATMSTNSPNVSSRANIYQFPIELNGLRFAMSRFISNLMRRNTFQETPNFRGFYLTSGTQEGQPLRRVLGNVERAFGLNPSSQLSPIDSKSYFVTDLFRKVVFPEQHLAGRTEAILRKQRMLRWGTALACIALAIIVAVPAGISFVNNHGLLKHSVELTSEGGSTTWKTAELADIEHLAPSLAWLNKLEKFEREGVPMSQSWGMAQEQSVHSPFRSAWAHTLDEGFGVPTAALIDKELRALQEEGIEQGGQFAGGYALLKLRLMTTLVEHLDPSWAVPRLLSIFASASGADDSAIAALEPHIQHYFELMKAGKIPAWHLDEKLLSSMRAHLARTPRVEHMYDNLIRTANEEIPPIRREHIFFGTSAQFVSGKKNVEVLGAYTEEGWHVVRALLEQHVESLTAEGWVIGGTQKAETEAEVAKQNAELKELYFARYTAAWTKFLEDLLVHRPDSLVNSRDELEALTAEPAPYLRLARVLASNSRLEMSTSKEEKDASKKTLIDRAEGEVRKRLDLTDAEKGEKVEAKKRELSPVEKAFLPLINFGIPAGPAPKEGEEAAPTELGTYLSMLGKLLGMIKEYESTQPPPPISTLSVEFQNAYRATNELLGNQSGLTRPLLEPLLLEPIAGAWAGIQAGSSGAAEGLWEVTAWEQWHLEMEGKYPFADSPSDTTLEAFTSFFAPKEGALPQFVENQLAGAVHRQGKVFVASKRFNSGAALLPAYLSNCLSRGADISDKLFGGDKLAMKIQVNLRSVSPDISSVELKINGNAVEYRNTPERWLSAEWPGENPEQRGATLRVKGIRGLDEEIIRDGDFGWFRLLDTADDVSKADSTGAITVRFNLRSVSSFVEFDVRPVGSREVLTSSVFRDYKCPKIITVSGR